MSDGEEHPAGVRPEPRAFPDMRPADDGVCPRVSAGTHLFCASLLHELRATPGSRSPASDEVRRTGSNWRSEPLSTTFPGSQGFPT